MDQLDFLIIQETESLEYLEVSQGLFDASARVRIGGGGYSTVYKEVIPAGNRLHKTDSNPLGTLNQSFPLTILNDWKQPLSVARKWFPYTPDFQREFSFVKTLTSPPNHGHDRIVKPMAVVVIDPQSDHRTPTTIGKHSILFPLADLDLDEYLQTEDFSRFKLKHLLKELFHLADALSFLHGGIRTSNGTWLVGSHMDLKPRNILVFRGEGSLPVGSWKLTDFSTSTLTDENGHDHPSPPKLVPEIYMAPEIQDPIEENRANPACDIWSFGCIIVEILVAYVEGRDAKSWKDKHGNSRCYYEQRWKGGEERVRVESRVWNWINTDYGMNHSVAMCKQLVLDMLKIDPTERVSAEQVRDRLEEIILLE